MKKYIIITGDTNDGDYISEKTQISDENLEIIKPVIKAIKDYNEDKTITYQKWNWWDIKDYNNRRDNSKPTPKELYLNTGKCSQEAFDIFNDYIPHDEYGIHSIDSIELLTVIEEQKLL